MGITCSAELDRNPLEIAQVPATIASLEKQGIEVALPGTPAYQRLRWAKAGHGGSQQNWNKSSTGWPAAICVPTTYAQTAAIVKFVVQECAPLGIQLCIASGRHSCTCLVDDTVVIDVSKMSDVKIDTVTKTATIQCGNCNRSIDAATAPHNLACTLGNAGTVGVGSILNAGVGFLGKINGLCIDNIYEYTLVNAKGDLVTVTQKSDKDLFWALQGAGQNFGLILEYKVKLLAIDPTMYGGARVIPPIFGTDRPPLVKEFRDLLLKDEAINGMMALPYGGPVVQFLSSVSVSPADAQKKALEMTPYGTSCQIKLQEWSPTANYFKDAQDSVDLQVCNYEIVDLFIPALDDDLLEFCCEMVNKSKTPGNPDSAIILTPLGVGKVAKRKSSDCAFPHRNPNSWFLVSIANMGSTAETRKIGQEWLQKMKAKVSQKAIGGYGVPESKWHDPESCEKLIYGSNLNRVRQLKEKYDPQNVFALNANVRPKNSGWQKTKTT